MRSASRIFCSLLALLFLISLWTYQLPSSTVRRALLSKFRPVAQVMYTNRRYRMYAPDPRAHKNVPYLIILDAHNQSMDYDLNNASYLFSSLAPSGREKWSAFIYHLSKSLLGEWPIYPPVKGRTHFDRLAKRICRQHSLPPAATVELAIRPVSLGTFQAPPEWKPFTSLARYRCLLEAPRIP